MNPPYTIEHLLELYPRSTPARFGELDMTLGQALDMRALGCPEQPGASGGDTTKDLAYLATKLAAAGSLRPEDYNLIELVPKTES